jgi:CDP-paratose 2-epimerase
MSTETARERVLITGGAGFVGTNIADRVIADGRRVRVYDSLVRPGVVTNLRWLQERHGERVEFVQADVRDAERLGAAVDGCETVFHLAAQVAVTTSLVDPVEDFEVNARGTLNLLEALRRQRRPARLVFSSTNKVYGSLPDVTLTDTGSRWEPADRSLRDHGIDERRPLDFHSPYGCSKGAADQYVIDYARTFGLPAVVLRMSCIYGPHQHGTEDQGWVAHFLIRALAGQPITLYGDGKQVRDILFVEDLAAAFLAAEAHVPALAGQAFNIGGGPPRAISLLELLALIERLNGSAPDIRREGWRPGDQRYYVSDTSAFGAVTGWTPRVDVNTGVARLLEWLAATGRRSAARGAHAGGAA